ncbi:mitochondrion organization and biogenesis protein [Colletotrichum plurivorum]|uniref:Mitochondrion organization and biogenesis protein n=1 Tax=Colletotrichum plurivorum TaxID=2175906 RepID=A0A8H6KPP2_9PEZI|nr:mitochondrion organization and biogenesis protein [Colletotrichum plurivorum]
MLLINTTTLELMWFNRPHGDTPPYAVLSHVWGHDEISHQDLTGGKDLFIHKKSYPKLMEACRIAQEQGLGYLWYDSCCIDFTNAKEPFRSIASQFQVFKSAKICIAYLCDVLAPSTNATTGGISFTLTTGTTLESAPNYDDFCRTAPRAEDVAYALYGLFDVHRRPLDDWAEKHSTWDKCKDIFQSSQLRGLLAKSPEDFSHCGRLFPPLGTGGQDDYSRADQEEDNHGGSSDDWDVSSVASFGSSTTLVGSSASATVNSGLTKAVTFFLDTDTVYPLLEAAVKKPSIGADRLRRNLVRLLRKLGLELTLEASTKDESLAAAFLRQHRIPIAWAVIARPSEKYLELVPSVPLMSTGEDFPEALGTSAPEAQGDERAETFASHEDDEGSGPEGDGTAAKEE